MTGDNSQDGKCTNESLRGTETEKSSTSTRPSSMQPSDTAWHGGTTKQDEVPANMLPSVTAASARPEAFAVAFEVALAFAYDEGMGSKVRTLTAAPEVGLGSGATGEAENSLSQLEVELHSTKCQFKHHSNLQPKLTTTNHHSECQHHTPRRQVRLTTSLQTNRLKSSRPHAKFDQQDHRLQHTSYVQVHSLDSRGSAMQHVQHLHKSDTPKPLTTKCRLAEVEQKSYSATWRQKHCLEFRFQSASHAST